MSGARDPSGSAQGDGAQESQPFVAYESLSRRLSRAELDATLRDLWRDDSAPATRFLAEEEYAPYDNDYARQLASQALIDALEAMAEDVATRTLESPSGRAAIVPCTPSAKDDEACFRETLESVGLRAFRRPLTPDEVDAYLPLLAFASEEVTGVDNDFYTAVALFLRAVLQDPEFLYRLEIGGETQDAQVRALSDYEIATRLSYLIWGSTPDDALLARAAQGDLAEASARREEAQRLFDDDRAKVQLERFHAMWLGYRALPHPPELTSAFAQETAALIERVVFDEQRDYLDLFRFDETYVDRALAERYGLEPPPSGFDWVSYGDTGRAGILSHGSVLSAFSKFNDTSPTQRGIFVRTRLLCQDVGSPPAQVMVDKPPSSDASPCKEERYKEHASGSCAGCHTQIDPIGFGLERYDVGGQYREHDDGLPECAISGQGVLPGAGTFSGPAELGEKLIESFDLPGCIVQQYLTFALGRAIRAGDAEAVEVLTRAFETSRRDFREFVLELVASDAFALRKEPS